jgi:hypothetical protein
MAKAKKPSLLEAIKVLPKQPAKQVPCWYDKLRQRNPDLYAELREVVRDFNKGGPTYEVFKTISAMHRYLLEADEKRTGPKLLSGIGLVMFTRFVEFVRVNPNG